MVEETREFETDNSVRDYHVHWMPVIGEQLVCEREEGNGHTYIGIFKG